MEKAKSNAKESLEDVFVYEMEILNYDRVLSSEERQRRFYELVSRVRDEKIKQEESKS